MVSVTAAWLAVLAACRLRRHEIAELTIGHLQQREGHWAIVDLAGKGGHIRTIPVPDWGYSATSDWMVAAGIQTGKFFRKVNSAGKPWGEGVTEKLVRHVVKEFAKRRTAGGELEQIQFLLGHVSVQTTERYLGCVQRIAAAVNDKIGIGPTS